MFEVFGKKMTIPIGYVSLVLDVECFEYCEDDGLIHVPFLLLFRFVLFRVKLVVDPFLAIHITSFDDLDG